MKKIKCPECKEEERIAKIGNIVTRSMGEKIRYRCGKCGRTFYAPDQYYVPEYIKVDQR